MSEQPPARPSAPLPRPVPFATLNHIRELTTDGKVVGAYAVGIALGLQLGDRVTDPELIERYILAAAGPALAMLEPLERALIIDIVVDLIREFRPEAPGG